MSRYLFRMRKRELFITCLFFVCSFFLMPEQTIAYSSLTYSTKNQFDLFGGIPPDQLYLGMYTVHFDPKSRGNRNATNNLVGIQVEGLFLGTLINSFDKRSWAFGISREFYRTNLSNNWHFASGYRIGLITGYEDEETLFDTDTDVAPFADLHVQISYLEHFGAEVMLTSSLSLLFFFQF